MTDQFFHKIGTRNLPCGWSKDGCQTFNQLAKEVYVSRREHGEEFDNAFKEAIEEEMASTNKTGKRKRNIMDTYNDLNEGELIIKEEEDSEEERWVSKHVFLV